MNTDPFITWLPKKKPPNDQLSALEKLTGPELSQDPVPQETDIRPDYIKGAGIAAKELGRQWTAGMAGLFDMIGSLEPTDDFLRGPPQLAPWVRLPPEERERIAKQVGAPPDTSGWSKEGTAALEQINEFTAPIDKLAEQSGSGTLRLTGNPAAATAVELGVGAGVDAAIGSAFAGPAGVAALVPVRRILRKLDPAIKERMRVARLFDEVFGDARNNWTMLKHGQQPFNRWPGDDIAQAGEYYGEDAIPSLQRYVEEQGVPPFGAGHLLPRDRLRPEVDEAKRIERGERKALDARFEKDVEPGQAYYEGSYAAGLKNYVLKGVEGHWRRYPEPNSTGEKGVNIPRLGTGATPRADLVMKSLEDLRKKTVKKTKASLIVLQRGEPARPASETSVDIDFTEVERIRRDIGAAIDARATSEIDKAHLVVQKKHLDAWVSQSILKAAVKGDVGVLDRLKETRDLWAAYHRLFQSDSFIKYISNDGLTGHELYNIVTSMSKNNKEQAAIIDTLKRVFPPAKGQKLSPQLAHIRQEIILDQLRPIIDATSPPGRRELEQVYANVRKFETNAPEALKELLGQNPARAWAEILTAKQRWASELHSAKGIRRMFNRAVAVLLPGLGERGLARGHMYIQSVTRGMDAMWEARLKNAHGEDYARGRDLFISLTRGHDPHTPVLRLALGGLGVHGLRNAAEYAAEPEPEEAYP